MFELCTLFVYAELLSVSSVFTTLLCKGYTVSYLRLLFLAGIVQILIIMFLYVSY